MALFSEYDFINAKVHGMRSRLYEAERLSHLLSCNSLPELLQILCPRRGPVFVSDVAVEKLLTEQYFQSLAEIRRHMRGTGADLLQTLLLRRTLENFKVIIQFWHMAHAEESPPGPIEDYMVDDPGTRLPPIVDLVKSTTLRGLLDRLPWPAVSPGFPEALGQAIERYEEDPQVFYIFVALDKAYFDLVWRRVHSLRRSDRSIAIRILGTELDINNIFAVFRLRLNYRLSPHETLRMVSPHGRLLTQRILGQVCQAEGAGEIIDRLPGEYRTLFAQAGDAFGDCERSFWDVLHRMANRTFYESLFNIGVVLGFYVLKKIEFMNLVGVIQGYRYDLPPNAIRGGLIPLAR